MSNRFSRRGPGRPGILWTIFFTLALAAAAPLSAASPDIVVRQVYGGGGNSGATLKNDFVELFNRGTVAVNVTGWSVQYGSSAGTTWQATALSGTIAPGRYYLVQEAQGAGGTTDLPTPDAVGTIAMSATAGKIALVNNSTLLSGACPASPSIVDLVGYGGVNCSETSPTPALTNTTAALRNADGCTDTDNNSADFSTGAPNPRNSASPASPCGAPTNPAGTGAANPPGVFPGDSTLLTVAVTPGTNPASTGLTVAADLTSIGGSATQAFYDDGTHGDLSAGDNTFSFSATVAAATTPGGKSLPFTIADAQSRTGGGSISLTIQAAGPPPMISISQVYGGGGNSGTTFKNDFVELFNRGTSPASLTGWSVQYTAASGTTWQVTTLSGSIAPGHYYLVQEAAGTGGTVNLPAPDAVGTIAMSATAGKVALVNNSTALSGACPTGASIADFVGYGSSASCFEGSGPAPSASNTTAAKRANEGCTDTNNNAADFSAGIPNPRNSASSTDCNAPTIQLFIHEIQGPGTTSPYAGQTVMTTLSIVTAVKSNGLFIQVPDGEEDADPNTSEGIFVFTGGAPGRAVGDAVTVRGTVSEFVPSQDPLSPPVTEISGSPTVTLLSTGNVLPLPVTLTAADTSPSGSIEQLEKYEGMRVHVDSLTAVAPTQGTIDEANATSTSNGVFYGVITGVARPLREPGIEVPDPLPPGSPCCVPRFDANPERLRIDSDAQPGALRLDVAAGSVVTNLTGPLDYAFRTYTILPDPAPAPLVTGVASAIPVAAPAADEFTVASFNMERFYDTVNDPATSDAVLTPAAFAARLNKASLAIRNVMRSPDILGVEEVENLPTLQAVADKVNGDAVAAGNPNPGYQAYLFEGNDIGGIDVGFLVKSSRVTVLGVTQEGKDATYINPNNGLPELLNDRPSLVLRATVANPAGPAFPITVIVNHLRSLSGVDDPADGSRVRAKRRAQAEFLANLVQARQAADPTERIVLVGDFNAFQFNDGYVEVIGTVEGAPAPPDTVVLASPDLVNPNLIDLVDTAPPGQRYSFSFDGNAQVLDHILVTENLLELERRFAYARNDADFPETYRADATRPERISDHDMPVAYFAFPASDLSLAAAGSPDPVTTGGNVTYTLTIGNAGPNTATQVTLTDELPAEAAFLSCSATGGGICGGTGAHRTVAFAALAPGATATVTLVAQVDCAAADGTVLTNTASVSAGAADPNPADNEAVTRITAANPAPSLSCPPDRIVPAQPGSCSAEVAFETPVPTDNCPGAAVVCSIPSGSAFPVGTTTVTCTAIDSAGRQASCAFQVKVQDTQPPVLGAAAVDKPVLWPPNHKMVPVTVSYSVADNCGASTVCALSVTSNEAVNGSGDGNTSTDWQVVDAQHVLLRAERSGNGNGRIYTVGITCSDAQGNASHGGVTVQVPH